MDLERKESIEYKKGPAKSVLENGYNGDCTRIPVTSKVSRAPGPGNFSGAIGASYAGKETNIAMPAIETTIDCGKRCDHVLERDLLVSHFDIDHVEGIGKAICNAINRNENLDIFLPSMKDHAAMKNAISVFTKQDTRKVVKIHEMNTGDKVHRGKNKMIEAFDVVHAPESKGYVVWMKDGDGTWKQELTYTGDIDPGKMDMNIPQITGSKTLVIDGSYSGSILPLMEPVLDLFTNHASTGEIKRIAGMDNNIRDIGIIHLPLDTCMDIENDIVVKFNGGKQNVYLLQTCITMENLDPLKNLVPFKKVVTAR